MTQAKNEEFTTGDAAKLARVGAMIVGSFLESVDDDAAIELGRGLARLVQRFAWGLQGTFTPEGGMFDTFMLAMFQDRDPNTILRWCKEHDVPLRKAGRPFSYKGSEIVDAARGASDGEEASGKG
ncbi:MAG: hypothetical protein IT428_18580 [Planctomycetaceae bacterium]|nr:hypothetical protein [Planctomycetaceae bacterium]